jgi:hypothetical protein
MGRSGLWIDSRGRRVGGMRGATQAPQGSERGCKSESVYLYHLPCGGKSSVSQGVEEGLMQCSDRFDSSVRIRKFLANLRQMR